MSLLFRKTVLTDCVRRENTKMGNIHGYKSCNENMPPCNVNENAKDQMNENIFIEANCIL